MTRSRESVTVVIPTLNAAALLPECLKTVKWADEIVVVDRFSSDETPAICESTQNCRLFQREGLILPNQNYGFRQATSDWILRLDADEHITPELADEIQSILSDPPGDDVVGYNCWERVVILGQELRYGFGRRHSRKMLFRRGRAWYPERSEHDDLVADGLWRETRHGYMHYNYERVRDYLVKMNRYTDADVPRSDLPERIPPIRDGVIAPLRAFYLYFGKYQGFRDGWVGFVDAAMRSVYQFVTWAKMRERWIAERGTS